MAKYEPMGDDVPRLWVWTGEERQDCERLGASILSVLRLQGESEFGGLPRGH